MRHRAFLTAAASGLALPSLALAQVLGGTHVSFNFAPFGGNQTAVDHQVFRSGLFTTATRITGLGFAPNTSGAYAAGVTIRMGYTDRDPNLAGGAAGGLDTPLLAAGGAPNADGPMFTFFDNPAYAASFSGPSPSNFQMDFTHPTGFVYFPGLDNLLIERATVVGTTLDVAVSRADPSANASRAFNSSRFPGVAGPVGPLRTDFTASPVVPTILPTWPVNVAVNVPVNAGSSGVHHQVHMAPTLTPMSAGGKLAIQALRFQPTIPGSFAGSWRINMGYTDRRAGFGPASGGLNTPLLAGGGAPNASGTMRVFFNRNNFAREITSTVPATFQLELGQYPFIYDPAQGNLLVEQITDFPAGSGDLFLAHAPSSRESTRAFAGPGLPIEASNTRALRTEFVAAPVLEEPKPASAHVSNNLIPFGRNQTAVMHQVFDSSQFGPVPVRIHSIAFAPGVAGHYSGQVTIRMGYTDRAPGVAGPAGLSIPAAAGQGAPNAAIAPMRLFRSGGYAKTFVDPAEDNFQMLFMDVDTFRYNPALGNLLVEIVAQTGNTDIDLTVSRAAGGPLASRAYRSDRFTDAQTPTQATRVLFTYFVDQLPCDADLNADGAIDFNDLLEFLNRYNDSNPAADLNDDGSVDFNDLLEFLNRYNTPC